MAALLYRTEKKIKPIEARRPTLSREDLESVLDCLINDQLNTGALARRFEKSFASTFGFGNVLAVNSLSGAYHLALLGLDAGPEDAVLMSVLAPIQACDATRYTGARPVLLDTGRDSFHPGTEAVLEALEVLQTENTRKVFFILDHTYGSPSPVDAARLRQAGIKVIEDFTGMVGAEREGAFFGQKGDAALCGTAEYDLLTTGNGALVITDDQKLFAKIHDLRYGGPRKENSLAYDYTLEDFQAAMGLVQLSRLGITLGRRRKIGMKYMETLRTTKHATFFIEPGVDSYLQFPVVIDKPHEEVKRYFNSLQIGVTRAVEPALHRLLGRPGLEFPNGERFYRKAISIPIYPNLTANNVDRIASSLRGLV